MKATIDGIEYLLTEKYNSLTLAVREGDKVFAAEKSLFICDCGNRKMIRVAHVRKGITVSCGCAKRKHYVKAGQRVGRLTVISGEELRVEDRIKVECVCDCGTLKIIGVSELATGVTNSCGCLVVENLRAISFKHGGEGTPLYSVWHTMKNRCYNHDADNYARYGGRGIRVCDEWVNDFSVFREWAESNGYSKGLQIDLEENDGMYEPSNCRFVTPVVNANNRGNNVILSAFGENKTMRDWSRDSRCKVSYATLKQRIASGKDHEWSISQESLR